jgi:hypothetical protein
MDATKQDALDPSTHYHLPAYSNAAPVETSRKVAKLDKRIARTERKIQIAEVQAGKTFKNTAGQLRIADKHRKQLDKLRFRRAVAASGGRPVLEGEVQS